MNVFQNKLFKIQCFIFNSMTEVCGDTMAESCVFKVMGIRNVSAEYHVQLIISYLIDVSWIEVTSFTQKDLGEVRNRQMLRNCALKKGEVTRWVTVCV